MIISLDRKAERTWRNPFSKEIQFILDHCDMCGEKRVLTHWFYGSWFCGDCQHEYPLDHNRR